MIDKNSKSYFLIFFSLITFGFIILLGFTHDLLLDKINESKKSLLNTSLNNLLKCNNIKKDDLNGKTFYYCKNNPHQIAMEGISHEGYSGDISYIALYDFDYQIQKIEILEHKETAGLGDKIEDKSWLSTIYEKYPEQLYIKKDGGDIDSFSAASITPRALLASLQKNLIWVKNNTQALTKLINN